ncbi:hypothetical protein [Paraburkholderia sp. C35]|uniref:hypothetical protein n=1 Tax=Paraburkholderia sp. C35 TaxID=2126993 RepID=UPI000D6966A1|nr:hypothetical protein [Paraburkholderia sp. C35]
MRTIALMSSLSRSMTEANVEDHIPLLRRAHGLARHAVEHGTRSRNVDLRKARQRSVIALKSHGLDRTANFAY